MRKLIALIFLCLSAPAFAQPTLIPYGTQIDVPFCLYDYTTPNEKEVTVTFEAADVKVSQSGTEGNSSNSPTDNGDCFKVTLASTETDTTWVNVMIDDDDNVWLPINMTFWTFGHPSAALPWIGAPGILSGTTAAAANGASNVNITTSLDGEAFNNGLLVLGTCTGGPGARIITGTTDNGANVDLTVNSAFDADPNSCPFYILNANQAVIAVDSVDFRVEANVKEISDDATVADELEEVLEGADGIAADIVEVDGAAITDAVPADIVELDGTAISCTMGEDCGP